MKDRRIDTPGLAALGIEDASEGNQERYRRSLAAEKARVLAAPIGNQAAFDLMSQTARGDGYGYSPRITASAKDQADPGAKGSMRSDSFGTAGSAVAAAAAQVDADRFEVDQAIRKQLERAAQEPPVSSAPPPGLTPPPIAPPPRKRGSGVAWFVGGAIVGGLLTAAVKALR